MSQQSRRNRRPGRGARAGGTAPGGAEATFGSVTLPRPDIVPPVKPDRPAAAPPRRAAADRRRRPTPAEMTVSPAPVAAPRPRRVGLTCEGAAYVVLIVAAALSRFWDLGSRALHHDESLHAYYSWVLSTGGGYEHDPLMHGPFLFLANALAYLLAGASDATSRYVPALFGTILVGLPYLLRGPRFLGRFGALAASFLFLISPSFLYYSRYIRHDLYTVVGSLLLFTCLARYVEKPQRGWLVGAGANLAFLLANHEVVFAIAAVFAGYLWGGLLWGRLRPLLPLQIGALALAGALWLALPALGIGETFPQIPWDKDGIDTLPPTRENQFNYYVDLLTHPVVVALLVAAAAFVAGSWWVVQDERRRRGPLLEGSTPGSFEAAVFAAGRDRTGLWIALAVAGVIFATLFTTLYTNVYGLASGTIATNGTLFYWLGQQDVRRGDQPWFFFLLLAPQYEFLLVLCGIAGAIVTLWNAFRKWREPNREDRALFFRLWLVVWFGAIFAGLSYAGEKMPWLIVHFTLPGLMLAGAFLGDLAERAVAARRAGRGAPGPALSDGPWPQPTDGATAGQVGPSGEASRARRARPLGTWADAAWLGPGLAIALLALAGGWWLLAADLTFGEFARPADGVQRRVATDAAADRWLLLALPPLATLALVGGAWFVRGGAFAGRWAAVALAAGLALLQVHVAWRLAYLEGDTPKDMLIYNQTSPDVTRMMREIGALSDELTGGKGIVIWYDNNSAWPMQWYLRDYSNRRYFGDRLNAPPPNDVALVIVANDNLGNVQPYLSGYTPQEYVLRWHFPEERTYRNFAIAPELHPSRSAWGAAENPHGLTAILASIGDSLATQLEPEGQQRVWRLVMYRDLPVPITGYGYTLYIRNDLLPLYNGIRY